MTVLRFHPSCDPVYPIHIHTYTHTHTSYASPLFSPLVSCIVGYPRGAGQAIIRQAIRVFDAIKDKCSVEGQHPLDLHEGMCLMSSDCFSWKRIVNARLFSHRPTRYRITVHWKPCSSRLVIRSVRTCKYENTSRS